MPEWKGASQEEIEKESEQEGEFWDPWDDKEVPNPVQGVVEEVKEGKFKKQFMKIRDKNGDLWITQQHGNLHNQIKLLKIKVQEQVHLTFTGEKPNEDPGYSPTKLYKLLVWRE